MLCSFTGVYTTVCQILKESILRCQFFWKTASWKYLYASYHTIFSASGLSVVWLYMRLESKFSDHYEQCHTDNAHLGVRQTPLTHVFWQNCFRGKSEHSVANIIKPFVHHVCIFSFPCISHNYAGNILPKRQYPKDPCLYGICTYCLFFLNGKYT